MNRRGHAGRTDANHLDVVRALLDAGCSVQSLAVVGLGCPDIVAGFAGVNVLIELKNEENIPSQRKLNGPEKKWHESWKGQVVLVESPEQAVEAVKAAIINLGVSIPSDRAAAERGNGLGGERGLGDGPR